MTHRWKSSAALLLSAAIAASTLPVHANAVDGGNVTEVTDWAQIGSLIENNWDELYFGEITVDTDSDTMMKDGEDISLQSEFDISTTEEKLLYQSSEYAETYFSGSDQYDAYTDDEGNVHISSPYQTCRLYVYAEQLHSDYGASKILHLRDYDEYILQFDTEEDTAAAYEKSCAQYGSDQCFLDQVRSIDYLSGDITQSSEKSSGYTSWGISYMGLDTLKETIQDYTIPKNNVVVAVVDTGISSKSKLLSGRKVTGFNFTSSKSNDYYDYYNHGTVIAGIIAEGTPSSVEIMALRVFDKNGHTSDLIMNTALQYAGAHNADVVNMSLGSARPNNESYAEYSESIQSLYNKGVVTVCAAGNSSGNIEYPASMPETIAVSHISKNEKIHSSACHGPEMDFSAPGVEVLCYDHNGRKSEVDGSSAASPHVAAAAAVVKMVHPNFSSDQVKSELKKYAHDLGANGKDNYYGYGSIKIKSYLADNAKYKLKDIPSNAWYKDAVNYVYDHGIMAGTGKGLFAPNGTMSRAMVAQVLYNLVGKPIVSNEQDFADEETGTWCYNSVQQFSDVKPGSWYYDAVQWAGSREIVAGTGNGCFSSDQDITREEFATILYQYEGSPEVSGNLDFADTEDVDEWAIDAMTWATQSGIISGAVNEDNILLLPRKSATRAQAASIFMNYKNQA